jgi:uncharacterized protein (TIGR02646 family)
MRFIGKNIYANAATLLNDWNQLRKQANQALVYDDFNNKTKLNEFLREEQGDICCYCQQKISHYQGNNNEGSHNEHLLPQNGKHARLDLQTQHRNIYACCNYSKGTQKSQQYCGEAKHDEIVYDFLKWVDCSSQFKYNTLGEITPQGSYYTMAEFEVNVAKLTPKQQEALKTIQILNLNQDSLKIERKKDQTQMIHLLNKLTKQQIQEKIQIFNSQKPYMRFIDMLLYYMKQKK